MQRPVKVPGSDRDVVKSLYVHVRYSITDTDPYRIAGMNASQFTRATPHVIIWLAVQTFVVVALGVLLGGESLRSVVMTASLAIIALRMAVTVLMLLPRPMPASEAFVVGLWLLIIYITFGLLSLRNPEPFGVWGWIGLALFIEGSFINTVSEFQRLRFKRKPENRGKLYTGGLFSFAMHINYTGDIELAIGAALIAGHWLAGLIPVAMAALFVFVHIPRLDAHLAQKYGQDFQRYRESTAKLIPWIY
ncbi:MAG: DUF1295 domain-containing protein [Spirochaetaceae bacterium]|nr:MAG: DUF1295 domain-containing protein [Spirochaetaceae bacterium]